MATLEQLRAAYPDAQSDEQAMQMMATESGIDVRAIANKFGYDSGQGGLNAERASGSGASFRGSMYGVAEAGLDAAGLPTAGNWARRKRTDNEFQAQVAGSRAKQAGAVDDWRDIRGPGDAANYAAGLAYSTAPQMAAMAAGGAVGGLVGGPPGALAGMVAAGYPINVGQVLDNQREQSGTTDLLSASVLAVPYTAIDTMTGVGGKVMRAVGGGKTVEKVGEAAVDGLTKRVVKGTARTALEEAGGEMAQTGLEQAGRMAVDPNETFLNEQSTKRFVDAGVGGGVLGGLVGGVSSVRAPRAGMPAPPVNDAPGSTTDILNTQPLALTNTGVGTMVAFPDGSTAVGTDQELMARYNLAPEQLARLRSASAPNVDPAMGNPNPPAPAQPTIYADQGGAASTNPDVLYGQDNGDPGLAEARRRYMESQQSAADNQLKQKLEIEAAAREFAARKAQAHGDLVDNDANGQPMVQLKPRELELHHQITTLRDAGKMSPAQANVFMGAVKEALRSQDNKAVNAVRKAVEEVANPKPEAVAKPAANVAKPAAPVAAQKAPTPVAAPLAKPATEVAPKPAEAPAAAPSPAPVATPKVTDYAAYNGRSVAVEVPVEGRKPIRRVVKDAGAALKEADERASKFEELAQCIGGGHVAA